MTDLPEDVWHLILAQFDAPRYGRLPETAQEALSWKIDVNADYLTTLARLAHVNRSSNIVAERLLYRSLFVRPHTIHAVDGLLEGLLRHPERARHVRHLRIRATWSRIKRLPRTACSLPVIAAAEALPISKACRQQIIDGLKIGSWDAKFVLLLCLCPNVEAFQLRDYGHSWHSLFFALLAETRWFGQRAQSHGAETFLPRLRFVRAGWKNLSDDYFGDTFVAHGFHSGLLVVPIMRYAGVLRPILQLLPRLQRISFHRYDGGTRRRTRESIARRTARNLALEEEYDAMEDQLEARGEVSAAPIVKLQLLPPRYIACASDWDIVVDMLRASGGHLEAFSYDPPEFSRITTRTMLFDILPTGSLPALRHLDIARDMLYVSARYHPLQHKLPTTLHSLRILTSRTQHSIYNWAYAPHWLIHHVEDHDQQLVDLLNDPTYAVLRSVDMDMSDREPRESFPDAFVYRRIQLPDWPMTWSMPVLKFTRSLGPLLLNENSRH